MPKVIEKDLIVGGEKCGVFCAYEEIEPELLVTLDTPKLTRVLPAPHFYEKSLFFVLISRWEPGQKSYFPNGGFEVRDEGGARRSFDLDQIIIHPHLIQHKKTLDKMIRRAEKEQKKRERKYKKNERLLKPKNKTGVRGRPALDPTIKAAREAEKTARSTRSKGLRGRPKSTEVKVVSTPKVLGERKRGRPSLTPEARAAKVQAKANVRARSKGLRGRPKSRF